MERLAAFSRGNKAKRMLRGLYHGKLIKYGNQISHSDRKTRRRWLPNAVTKELYSEILDERIRMRVVTNVLRSIDKYMGFDNYIIMTNPRYLEGIGMSLKMRMLDKLRSEPDLKPDDFLNVSPECWAYLEEFDQKQAVLEARAEEHRLKEQEKQIEREEQVAQWREDMMQAKEAGEELPPRPVEKKRKTAKDIHIERRLAARERRQNRKDNVTRIMNMKQEMKLRKQQQRADS
uniref:Large ribosomal subunit protein bL28m n=1 Tax=Lotharella oceanica TaxID=641309 RepID=A0A7S2XBD7_9EUKA